jgi:rubrerythrin
MKLKLIEMNNSSMMKAVADRWESRVVANGWDEMGADGAMAYLVKYGKTMGEQKMEAFAEYADMQRKYEFAAEMRRQLKDRFGHKYEEEEPEKMEVWKCPRCGRVYGTKEEAMNCRR